MHKLYLHYDLNVDISMDGIEEIKVKDRKKENRQVRVWAQFQFSAQST